MYSSASQSILTAAEKAELLTNPNKFCEWISGEKQENIHQTMQKEVYTHSRVCLWAFPEAGKTRQITFRYLAWRILRDPNIRIGGFGAESQKAYDLLSGIKQTLQIALERGFGFITRIDQDRTERFIVRRWINEPEPTVQVIGIGGSFIGARLDIVFGDDFVTFKDTWSLSERKRKYKWITSSECMGRLLPEGQIIFLGNTWHTDDAMHKMTKCHGFHEVKIPIADDPVSLDNLRWPARFPRKRVLKKKKDVGSIQFEMQYFHNAIAIENQRFKMEWFEEAFERGEDLSLEYTYKPIYNEQLFLGLDYGVGEKAHHDKTVFCVLAIYPDLTRKLIWIEGGNYSSPALIQKLKEFNERYPDLVVKPEHAGQQSLLSPILREAGIRIVPHTTSSATKNNRTWGVEALATKVEAGYHIFPGKSQDNDHVKALINQCLFYSPADHTGDYLMSFWIADSAAKGISNNVVPKAVHVSIPSKYKQL